MFSTRVSTRLMMAASALLLSACASSIAYIPPQETVSTQWSVLTQSNTNNAAHVQVQDAASNETWWTIFHDPQLDRLVRQGLLKNHDLAAASAAADAADFDAGVAQSALFPRVDGSASIGRTRAGPAKSDLDTVSRIGAQGSFDIDPAGGNRRRQEAALAESDAARAERDRVRSELIADIALNYIRLISAKRQLAITQMNLDDQQKNLRITTGQRAQGAVSDLEVSRAKAQVEATSARIPQLQTQVTTFMNQLGVLTGVQPGTLNTLLQIQRTIPDVPQNIVVSTPISTIRQRPDIRETERRLARDTALHEAAIAAMYPSLSLSAFYGKGDSLNAGNFTPWNIAAGSLMPLIDFGRIRNQINAADARKQEAFHNYQQAVLRGLADVENNMAAYINERTREQSLSASAVHEGDAAHIAGAQYTAGTTGQIDLLLAQENKLEADLALAQSQQALAEDLVHVFQSLGWGALAQAPLVIDGPRAPDEVVTEKFAKIGRMQPIVDR